jgi:hypothetical protein
MYFCVAPQLLRILPLEPQLSALLGQDSSLEALLSAQPGLLKADPLSLQANCTHLQELLGQQAAAAAAKRCPQILGCSPYRWVGMCAEHEAEYCSGHAKSASLQ